jgi:3-hydroxybutyryl-CoA dehydrogenase
MKIATLLKITSSVDLAVSVKNADLVIEAVPENETLKQKVMQELAVYSPIDCIIASNTSSISITKLASQIKNPGRVVGMHFMNPVPLMQLVEVIKGHKTSPQTAQIVTELCKRIDKIPVEVQDYPGFISNRILMPMINEAIWALHEQVGTKEAIDTIMKLGMAHPMGPLELADFIGLDVCLSILQVLQTGFGNPKYAPCPLLVNMTNAGLLGKKSGEGFYKYPRK